MGMNIEAGGLGGSVNKVVDCKSAQSALAFRQEEPRQIVCSSPQISPDRAEFISFNRMHP